MTDYEKICLEQAVSFSAVRGASPFTRVRRDFADLADAVLFAECFGDKRTMIYAITETGNNAHIMNA